MWYNGPILFQGAITMNDTIAAIATGPVRSAIGILRLSGPEAIQAADRVFRPAAGLPLSQRPDRQLVYGALYGADGAVADHCLATVTRGPGSYTGEDTAELQCHGSPTVLAMGLEALFAQGVRQAGPGEFTRRAFLNGRLDLTQAEAVIDLIDAQTQEAARQAAGQLGGALSGRVARIYDGLVDLMAHFHAVLDYPDEDIEPFEAAEIRAALARAGDELEALLATFRRGRQLTEGVPCALVGRPNAGKSTLFNALLGYDRAIVTPVPGTTRDTVEERVRLGGVLLRLVDTAGLRETADPVERLGVARSRAAMERAALILVLWDGSVPAEAEDRVLLAQARALAPTVLVRTKGDLPAAPVSPLDRDPMPPVVEVSAATGQGLDRLEAAVAALFPPEREAPAGELLTNARQAEAAGRALQAVNRAGDALAAGMTPDGVLTDVEEALSALGELTGRTLREDIIDRIFQRFCVGK
jgi:tRNA modification GTPase